MTASARQLGRPLERPVPHLPKPVAIRNHAITNLQPLRWPAALILLLRAELGGGRNARATSRAVARHLDVSPGDPLSQITGCRWLCRNHPAESETLTFR